MRPLLRCLALLSVFALSANALADTLFYLTGTLQDGGTANGIISVSMSGYVGTVNVTVLDKGNTYVFAQGSFFEQQYPFITPPEFYSVSYNRVSDSLLLSFPSLLVGYTGGALCSTSLPCKGFASSDFIPGTGIPGSTENFSSLVATPVPESGTLGLVATGVLGVVGVLRRRILSR
jgi:hypothetical protein